MKLIMKLILGLLMLALPLALAQPDHQFEINILYNNGTITASNVKVIPYTGELELNGNYIAEVISYDNEILNLTFFSLYTTIYTDSWDEEGNIIGGGTIELEKVNKLVYVPYYENAKEINIYNENLMNKLTIPVEKFAKDTNVKEVVKEVEKDEMVQTELPTEEKSEPLSTTTKVIISVGISGLLILILVSLLIWWGKKEKSFR